jgi:hypothetical protein
LPPLHEQAQIANRLDGLFRLLDNSIENLKLAQTQPKVAIAPLPSRLIDKSSVGNGLLASILTDKYVDHLPLYRQLQRFKRENIPISRFHTGRLGETGNGTAGNPL